MGWSSEFNPDPTFTAWGPFIREDYYIQPVTYRAIIVAGLVFGLAILFAVSAAYIGFRQTKASHKPWKSAYIWMIWLELAASVVIAIECLLYLLKVIRPSFYFYMSICTSPRLPPSSSVLQLADLHSIELVDPSAATVTNHHQSDTHYPGRQT